MVGKFTSGGTANLAHLNQNTGAVMSDLIATGVNRIKAVELTPSTLYVGWGGSALLTVNGNSSSTGSIAKIYIAGGVHSMDNIFGASFHNFADGWPVVLSIYADTATNSVYIGGAFTLVDGAPRSGLARLDSFGSPMSFAPDLADYNPEDPSVQVEEIHKADGRIIACGDWWATEGQGQNVDDGPDARRNQYNIGKFNPTTGVSDRIGDRVWGPVTDGGVMTCPVDEDAGIVYLGGHYDFVNDQSNWPGGLRNEKLIAADLETGAIIKRWDTNTSSIRGIDGATVTSTGRLYAGGAFAATGAISANALASYSLVGPEVIRSRSSNEGTAYAPGQVQGFTATAGVQGDTIVGVTLQWSPLPGADRYIVYARDLSDGPGDEFVRLATADGSTTSVVVDEGVPSPYLVDFYVVAERNGITSMPSTGKRVGVSTDPNQTGGPNSAYALSGTVSLAGAVSMTTPSGAAAGTPFGPPGALGGVATGAVVGLAMYIVMSNGYAPTLPIPSIEDVVVTHAPNGAVTNLPDELIGTITTVIGTEKREDMNARGKGDLLPHDNDLRLAIRKCLDYTKDEPILNGQLPCERLPVFYPGSSWTDGGTTKVTTESTKHDYEAITGGRPAVLSYATDPYIAPKGWYSNQPECSGSTGGNTGMDCDEYPYRSTVEGGPGASLKPVPSSDNQAEGRALESMYEACGLHVLGERFAVAPMNQPDAPPTFYLC